MREVKLLTPYPQNTTITIVKVDKYGNRIDDIKYEKAVSSDGSITIELEENSSNESYYFFVDNQNFKGDDFFWVTPGDGVLEIDMNYNYSLPTFSTAPLKDAVSNADRVLAYGFCEIPIESLEDKRFICRFNNYYKGEEDLLMCSIDQAFSDLRG